MFQTIRNAWRVDEIRKKLLFMMFIILLYRLGNAVSVPYVDTSLLQNYFSAASSSLLGLLNTMSGSSLERASIFAMSIQPYINASIIIQLLTIAIPALERLSKEGGEDGKKKIEKITRYSTLAIGLLQGFGYFVLIRNNNILLPGVEGIWPAVIIIASFMTGSVLLMWMGEQITEFGVGNGISVILFISIVSRFPSSIARVIQSITFKGTEAAAANWWIYLLIGIGLLAIIVLIVIVNAAERRIPVQYSKRVVGRKMYGGQSTHLPMKVNMSGVLPIIFAQSIASIPGTIAIFVPSMEGGWFMKLFDSSSAVYMVLYFLLILFFSYFYSTVQFNPIEVANNLKKNGGFIPGFRAGKPTSEFIQRVLNKVTLFGAFYLAIIALTPLVAGALSKTAKDSGIALGGTSIIIVVSVGLDTLRQLDAQTLMRHYKGFLE